MLRSFIALLSLVLIAATACAADPVTRSTTNARKTPVPPALNEQFEAPAAGPQRAAKSDSEDSAASRKVDYQQPQWNQGPNLSSVLFKMVIGTVIALAACGGSLWYGRRWLQKTQGVMPIRGGELRLIESTRVGGHCFVHLLQVGNQRVLAGTDRSGLQSLIPLPEGFGSVLDEAVSAPAHEELPKAAATPAVSVDAYFGANERGRITKNDLKPRATV